MLKYTAVALALKLFSTNTLSRSLYRKLGNAIGKNAKNSVDIDRYTSMGNELVELCDKYQVFGESVNGNALELGTGWVHWYSLYTRLHKNIKITMFDVWDNRQLDSLKAIFSRCCEESSLSKHKMSSEGLAKLLNAESFDEIYNEFNLNYFISPDGDLSELHERSYDCIFSYDVLEHIPLDSVEKAIEQQYHLLKVGGYAIHNIGIGDHLTQYDRKESWKKYLEYSDFTWKLFFENKVQYINRLQGADWLDIFKRKGFTLLEQRPDLISLEELNINKKYKHYSNEDLACKALTLVFKKV